MVEHVGSGQRHVRAEVEQGESEHALGRAQRHERHRLEHRLAVAERLAQGGHGRPLLELRLREIPQVVQVQGAPARAGQRVGHERRQHQDLRRVARGEQQAGVRGAHRAHEDAEDALRAVLDLPLSRLLLGHLQRDPHLGQPRAREVALLAQVGDPQPQLGRRLRVGLREHRGRGGVRGRGRRPAQLLRHRELQQVVGRGLLGVERHLGEVDGDDLLLLRLPLREPRRPEHRHDRLLRPGGDRLPLGQRDHGVAARQVLERHPDDRGERLEDPLAPRRHRVEDRQPPGVQRPVEGLRLQHVRQVPLVVLQHHRDRGGVELLREQVPLQLAVGLHVLVVAVGRGVGDEHHPVRPAQHHPPRRRVDRLAGHRRELEPQVEPAEPPGLERQQVAQDRPVLLRVHGDELPAPPPAGPVVEHLQVGGLPADRRPVVGDLDLDEPLLPVELDHLGLRAPSPPPGVGLGGRARKTLADRPNVCLEAGPSGILSFPSTGR